MQELKELAEKGREMFALLRLSDPSPCHQDGEER